MIDLPANTVVNRFVPKVKFYSKTSVNSKLRQLFTDEIEKITWANKIAPDTLNITSNDYAELQVFEISLKGSDISNALLKHIDTYIPYPILFIIKKRGAVKAALSFKEPNGNNQNQMKVDSYFDTGWQKELHLELKGRSVDAIYRHYLYQVAPQLHKSVGTTTKGAVELHKEHQKIQKQLEAVNRKISSEPSIAKKQELARERHKLETELGYNANKVTVDRNKG